jgi:hypothetical protein
LSKNNKKHLTYKSEEQKIVVDCLTVPFSGNVLGGVRAAVGEKVFV